GDADYSKILEFQKNIGWNFDFDIKDFILVITIGAIMFTLLIKATSIAWLVKKLGIDKLNEMEKFEYDEGRILANLKILEKINTLYGKKYLTNDEYFSLKKKYGEKLKNAIFDLKDILKKCNKVQADDLIKKAISLHALGIEKQYLKNLFAYNEIDEKDFKFIFSKISKQKDRIENGESQIKNINEKFYGNCVIERFLDKIALRKNSGDIRKYIRNRAKVVITRKVLKELEGLKDLNLGFDKKHFDEVQDLYRKFYKIAEEKKDVLFAKNKKEISEIEAKLVEKSLLKLEEKVVKDLYEKEIITPKLYIKFIEEIEEEFYGVL
ncbi:hypothetical protein LR002_02970, partial [Candidatus Gracilibacteria bacterium]|nr:hypothetical protein [Candidatus Gracilibacteria bacterium]